MLREPAENRTLKPFIKSSLSEEEAHVAFAFILVNAAFPTVVQEGDLKRGDGVVFDSGSPEDEEEGGTVYDIKSSRKKDKSKAALAALMFGPGQVDFKRVKVQLLPHLAEFIVPFKLLMF